MINIILTLLEKFPMWSVYIFLALQACAVATLIVGAQAKKQQETLATEVAGFNLDLVEVINAPSVRQADGAMWINKEIEANRYRQLKLESRPNLEALRAEIVDAIDALPTEPSPPTESVNVIQPVSLMEKVVQLRQRVLRSFGKKD